MSTKEALRNLGPENQGQLTSVAWLEYVNRFKLMYSRLENPQEDEAWHWLVARVPESIRTALLREQMKRNNHDPRVRLTGVQDIPVEQVARLLAGTVGEAWAHRVCITPQGNGYLIDLPNRIALDRFLACNGRQLVKGHSPKVSVVEQKMPLTEVFEWVTAELKTRETSSACVCLYEGFSFQGSSKKIQIP